MDFNMSKFGNFQVERANTLNYINNLEPSKRDALKQEYVQHLCDFYNEHSPQDKEWFGRNFENCLEPIELNNICMYHFMLPLFVLARIRKNNDKI